VDAGRARDHRVAVQSWIFAAHALPPAVRARVELLRERAGAGLDVTCGGVSMEPALARGSSVRVRPGRPRVGAVAAFVTRRGDLELHRLIAPAPLGWWVHAGDNQRSPEPGLVHASQLIGVADLPRRRPGPVATARAAWRMARAAWRVMAQPR